MAEVEAAPAQVPAAAPAKSAKKKAAKPRKAGASVNDLILKALGASKERGGMSATAVKKALAADGYDVDKNKSRVNVAIKRLVEKGSLVQTKGTGASGSFKVNKKASEPKAKKPAKVVALKSKKPAAKKAVAAKKSKPAVAKKPAAAKKSIKVKKPTAAKTTPRKSPKKAVKKAPKSPRKSPKSTRVAKKTKAAVAKKPAKKVAKTAVKKAVSKKK